MEGIDSIIVDLSGMGAQAMQNECELSCWLMDSEYALHMFIANALIIIPYIGIPVLLTYLLYVFYGYLSYNFRVIHIGFIAFILACMLTHVVKIANFYWGNFILEIILDYNAGIVSSATMILLYISTYRIYRAIQLNPDVVELSKPVLIALGVYSLRNMTAVTKFQEGGNKVFFDDMLRGLTFEFQDIGKGCLVRIREVVDSGHIVLDCIMEKGANIDIHMHPDFNEQFEYTKGKLFDMTNKIVVENQHTYKSGLWHSFFAIEDCEMVIHCKKVKTKNNQLN